MSSLKVICPGCAKKLPLGKPPRSPLRVCCSECGFVFVVKPRAEDVETSGRKPDHVPLWVGLAFACLFLIGGLAIGLYRLRSAKKDEEVAVRPDPVPFPSMPAPPTTRGLPTLVPAPPRSPLTAVEQAVARGVRSLKQRQLEDGAWGEPHRVGLSALAALALLECQVHPDDAHVQKALKVVREGSSSLDKTYELALAILFLDRLKRPQDSELIQTLGLRLIAGQTQAGGWSYTCPVLPAPLHRDLLTALQATRPTRPTDLFVQGPGKQSLTVLLRDRSGVTPTVLDPGSRPPDVVRPLAALDVLPASLRKLPALQTTDRPTDLPEDDESDNSNTQFAALGLWAARRHGVPSERALAMVVRRFRNSQKPSGGWGYLYQTSKAAAANWDTSTPAMTGAGLLGLAMSWGLASPGSQQAERTESLSDPAIRKGLQTLGKCLGPRKDEKAALDLYFLWSLERVGVLYNTRTLGERDWYDWGSEQIVACQRSDGSWFTEGYRGATPVSDTSFALLFLKRADLAADLSRQIEPLGLFRVK